MAIGSLIGLPTAFSMLAAQAPHEMTVARSEIEDSLIVEPDDGDVTVERSSNGLFHTQARINGTPMRCLVDSGASG